MVKVDVRLPAVANLTPDVKAQSTYRFDDENEKPRPSWTPPASLPRTGLNACETLRPLATFSKGPLVGVCAHHRWSFLKFSCGLFLKSQPQTVECSPGDSYGFSTPLEGRGKPRVEPDALEAIGGLSVASRIVTLAAACGYLFSRENT
jgi:hypothetical protein